jgi:hypothetical protein
MPYHPADRLRLPAPAWLGRLVSGLKFIGAVLAEQNDQWTESRRYMAWKSSPPAGKPPSPPWDRITLASAIQR